MWPCIVTNFLIIKPTRCTKLSNLFCNETLHVSDSSYAHHQELFTVHTAMVYVIQVCGQFSSGRIRMELSFILILLESSLQICMTYTIAGRTVNNSWWWTEELSETCRFSFQNKFQSLVHLVGFIIRKCGKLYHALHIWRNVRPLILRVKFCFKMISLYISHRGHSPLVKTIEAWNCWVQAS
jgi:hypothetical protein